MAFSSTAPTNPRERSRLIHARLTAQSLAAAPFTTAREAVAAFGAMQGQDLPGVISSIALRLDASALPDTSDVPGADPRVAEVLRAFAAGEIVRGYPMRGTVFALAADDARWITELAAKPSQWEAHTRRQSLDLDERSVGRARAAAHALLEAEPAGVARADLFAAWHEAGVSPEQGRGYHLCSYFIASGVLAYGPHNGRDNNVVLAESWLPPATGIEARFNGDRIAATAALLERYLTSHGPATLRDFAWWTKLSLRDIRAAHALVADRVEAWGADAQGDALYSRPGLSSEVAEAAGALDALHLLPGFDELVLGYPDRLALLTEQQHHALAPGNNGVFKKSVLRRGQIVGTWKNVGVAGSRRLELEPFTPLPAVARREAECAYRRFPHPA
ncbi:MAG: winged helix DNA-binding domain-containing protein [Dermabacter sp.]|nr:winged helix DNA-binding domain-containing protein [Dermabacter sp.]